MNRKGFRIFSLRTKSHRTIKQNWKENLMKILSSVQDALLNADDLTPNNKNKSKYNKSMAFFMCALSLSFMPHLNRKYNFIWIIEARSIPFLIENATVFTALRTISLMTFYCCIGFDAVNSVSFRFTIHYDGLKLYFLGAYLSLSLSLLLDPDRMETLREIKLGKISFPFRTPFR